MVKYIPLDAPVGRYDIWIGFYIGEERLKLTNADKVQSDGSNRVKVVFLTSACDGVDRGNRIAGAPQADRPPVATASPLTWAASSMTSTSIGISLLPRRLWRRAEAIANATFGTGCCSRPSAGNSTAVHFSKPC